MKKIEDLKPGGVARKNESYQLMSDLPESMSILPQIFLAQAFVEEGLYTYKAYVTNVYDGDTVTVDIDFGMDKWEKNVKLRLARINAPEMRPRKVITVDGREITRTKHQREIIKAAAKISRDWLRVELPVGQKIIIKTELDKTDKYKRYIAEIYLNGININAELVSRGLAKFQTYK